MGLWLTEEGRQAESAAFANARRSAPQPPRGETHAKRIFDILAAGSALVALAPLIGAFALAVKLQDGGPAFFAQKRYGRDGRIFKCYKLRSMVVDADVRLKKLLETDPAARAEWEATQKLTNDPRITALGRFVRKTSIDELPQLFNVLRGDMSLVGPRPIVENEIAKYGENYRDYCAVRPGITGAWQVSGRSDTTYSERVQMDVEYAKTRSFWGDMRIVLETIPAVLLSRGAR